MPSASAAQRSVTNPHRDVGLGLLLGADYEKKKQKLQQELQLDYKQYVAKKTERRTSEARPQQQGLSLPFYDKLSTKEKLSEERNKEYNVFLQNKAKNRRIKRGTPLVTSTVHDSDASLTSPPTILNTHTTTPPVHRERPQRRDAATLTEAVDNGKSLRIWDPGHQGRRRWQVSNPKKHYSSEEELITDKDEELEFRHRWRKDRHTPEPESSEESRIRVRRANRASRDILEVETPGVHDHNNNNLNWKSDLQMTDNMKVTTRSRPATSKDKAEFATGLLIGTTEEQTASQTRKEIYKQELLKQIAEQQRNKIREKKLELRVAATGATDPEKEPDRIKQFGAVNQHYDSWRWDVYSKPGTDLKARGNIVGTKPEDTKPVEETEHGVSRGRSQVSSTLALKQLTGKTAPLSGTGAPQGVPSLDYLTEDYHRAFSNMLGKMTTPSVAGVPTPKPPSITDHYKTPYDAAYYYYGTRNPLDPHLPNFPMDGFPRGVPQPGIIHSPRQRPPPLRTFDLTEATDQHRASSLDVGQVLGDKSKQRRESVLSYQEALKQQIKEREERKRRDKEDKARYDAKIEAEIMAYNPWGKSGGGAPIKDQKGNLFSDLNQMHKINEETYRNPGGSNSERTPRSHRPSGFNSQLTPQQLDMQERYKESLKQQIEENKRKHKEEREQMKIEEEKEEKRLEEQRARIQREYEEEQRKHKKIEHTLEKQGWLNEPKSHRQEEGKRRRQEQDVEKSIPEDIEEKKAQLSRERDREPSPPIPSLLRNQTDLVVSRPSSVVSQLSAKTVGHSEHSVPASHNRPIPAKFTPLQDGHQEVIRELSALRRYLQKEKSEMEAQLGKKDQQERHYTPPNRHRRRPSVDNSESEHKQTDQPSARRLYSGTAHANMQNIRAFNQLKNRDTASREEVLHLYPDPPTDAQGLDIQQQTLLREQQRQIRRLKRDEEHDFSAQHLNHYYARKEPGRFTHRDSMLPSETAFIDVYSGDEQVYQQRPSQRSAKHQEKTTLQRRHDYDEAVVSVNQTERSTQSGGQSLISLNGEVRAHDQHRIRRRHSHAAEQKGRSERPPDDEADTLSLRSALERHVSMETVATEPWLRPGTSDAVKRSASRPKPNYRIDALPWLTPRIT